MASIHKTILITGCSSGIGLDSAVALAKRGHRVIATTRTENSAQKLKVIAEKKNINLESFKLDLLIKEDREKILNYDIDVLINNAGDGESGSLAEIDVDKVRNNFEVNVFTQLELTQLALKKMMKNNKGTIIFISSLAGRVIMPFLGSYCMTKFAITCGAETLRKEIYKIKKNVHVCLVEPGAYHTGFNQENIVKKYKWMDENSYFYKIIDTLKKEEDKYFSFNELKSTKTIVKKIIKASEAKKPKLRYSAPWWQYAGVQVMRIFGK